MSFRYMRIPRYLSRSVVLTSVKTRSPIIVNKLSTICNNVITNNVIVSKNIHFVNQFSTEPPELVGALQFEEVCEETLESLCDYFEDLVEKNTQLKGADVTYGDGVLTVMFGDPYGTYVINRQTPNRQIWLSSPTSGPKRYDFVMNNKTHWIYRHDGKSLHQLLQDEINKIVVADFSSCSHSLV